MARDESDFGGTRKGTRGRGAAGEVAVFGILERAGKVYTVAVPDGKKETRMARSTAATVKGSVFYADAFGSYRERAQFGKHGPVNHQETVGSGPAHIDGVEGFWSYAERLYRLGHGVDRDHFPLDLAEYEFRYSPRHESLPDILFEALIGPKIPHQPLPRVLLITKPGVSKPSRSSRPASVPIRFGSAGRVSTSAIPGADSGNGRPDDAPAIGMHPSAIAKSLGMSGDGLRKLIAPVEARLDGVLTDRDRNSDDRLVPCAEEFVAAAKRLIQDYDALFSPKKFGVRRVPIATYPSVASYFIARRVLPVLLPPALEQKRKGAPEPFPTRFKLYQLETTTAGRAHIIREVERGALDFGIIDRDSAQAAGPLAGGYEWSHLFVSSCYGFLYHRDNTAFATLAEASGRFTLDSLRSHTLVLNEGDSQAVINSLLADPFLGVATHCHLSSCSQVYEAVAANAGVGIGFEPKVVTPDSPVRFLPFSTIRCPSSGDQETVRRLAARGDLSFGLYVRAGWDRPRPDGGLTEAAKFVLRAVQALAGDYTHDYVS